MPYLSASGNPHSHFQNLQCKHTATLFLTTSVQDTACSLNCGTLRPSGLMVQLSLCNSNPSHVNESRIQGITRENRFELSGNYCRGEQSGSKLSLLLCLVACCHCAALYLRRSQRWNVPPKMFASGHDIHGETQVSWRDQFWKTAVIWMQVQFVRMTSHAPSRQMTTFHVAVLKFMMSSVTFLCSWDVFCAVSLLFKPMHTFRAKTAFQSFQN